MLNYTMAVIKLASEKNFSLCFSCYLLIYFYCKKNIVGVKGLDTLLDFHDFHTVSTIHRIIVFKAKRLRTIEMLVFMLQNKLRIKVFPNTWCI